MTELMCPACRRGYYTAAPYHLIRSAKCDNGCARELVELDRGAGGLVHLPEPLELQAKRQEHIDLLEPGAAR